VSLRAPLRFLLAITALLIAVAGTGPAAAPEAFRFAILGDRTGEAQPGVYEQAWREAAAGRPAFVVTTGDTVQGLNDAAAEGEWLEAERILEPYRRIPLYLVPGNHDIWSVRSEQLYLKHAARPLHYSFDYGQAHFTILDNSRTADLPAAELAFLEADLKAHAAQPVKFVFSHRPSWVAGVALQDSTLPLHQLARRYGVRYVIAGHVHQMLHFEFQGVTYLTMASSGAHLRPPGGYAAGWFFGHALVEVRGAEAVFRIEELKPPHGQGRITSLADWGMLGLVAPRQRAAGGS
jgi:predicted phosphodiesterase